MKTLLNQKQINALPDYVQKLIITKQGFEDLFLSWNKKYLEKNILDYLPDFEDNPKNEYWKGKLKWRFVGWDKKPLFTE